MPAVYAYAALAAIVGGILMYVMHYIDKSGQQKGIKKAEVEDAKKVGNVAARLADPADNGFSVRSKNVTWGSTVSSG
jgi:hypothetical protein